MAHPGTLPVPNKDAIKKVIQVGLAIDGTIADFTEFDRKNYFYPDIPKGYQLSQYKFPIVSGGMINGVAITRVHLEEDTAKSSHDKGGVTLIDYNRAGVPLMELVTEPVIHTREEASAFARELQRILRYVGASEANMEMGQMRIEVNLSVSKDPNKFGTKVEVKNINSFAAVEGAIDFEIARHIEVLENGGTIVQETRGWDEVKQETVSQRKKENAHDYRYFPDPDLPKLYLHEVFDLATIKKDLTGKLPSDYRALYASLSLKEDVAEALLNEVELSYFFASVTKGKDASFAQLASNYLVSDALGLLKKEGLSVSAETLPTVEAFKELIEMIQKGELSSRGAKDLLPLLMSAKAVAVKALAEEKGLIQKNDPEALKAIVKEVLAESVTQVADYKAGKESMFMYFVGQCMKKSKGAGNPSLFQELLKAELA
jgi:aspartyl-tRNA(Asn)/glutamyl-tRNA(Gln) amidotransferase subunit B